jgi:hypothetical protein
MAYNIQITKWISACTYDFMRNDESAITSCVNVCLRSYCNKFPVDREHRREIRQKNNALRHTIANNRNRVPLLTDSGFLTD